jgi:hypothetical protein
MWIIRESSSFRSGWDFLIAILVFVSCTVIPFQLAFQHPPDGSGWIYLIDLFFLFDIFLNFRTSFSAKGVEVVAGKEIKQRYLRTRFSLDVLANFPFDLLVLLLAPDWVIGQLSLVLVLRLLRLFRLFRLFAILRRWESYHWIHTGYLRILRFISVILLFIHWVACAWFLSGYLARFPADSWVVRLGLEEATVSEQYIRSLYWSITTMTTVGYGDISPARTSEYIIAMIVMLLGASMYAYIIGNVASLFSNLDAARAQYRNRVEGVTQYLHQRQVPGAVTRRIQNYYEYLWARRQGIRDEGLLEDLPPPLRLEVLLHLTRDLRETVPLFKYCSPTLRNVLLEALKAQTYPPAVDIVREAEPGDAIYFISKGQVAVFPSGKEQPVATLTDGEYFGDLSLLLKEKRTARVHSLSFTEVFRLELADFHRIKQSYPEFTTVMKKMSSEKTEKISLLVLEGVIL